LQPGPAILDNRGWNEHATIKVAQNPLAAGLGAVHGDDSKPLWKSSLDSRLNDSPGLPQQAYTRGNRLARISFRSHSNWLLFERKKRKLLPTNEKLEWTSWFLAEKNHIQAGQNSGSDDRIDGNIWRDAS
jgi:hypothetical protein